MVEMSLLWNDLAEIPKSFDEIVDMKWFPVRKSYKSCLPLRNQIGWKINENAIQNGRLDISCLISL